MPGSSQRTPCCRAARIVVAANAAGVALWLGLQTAAAQQPPSAQSPSAVGLPVQPGLLQNPPSQPNQTSSPGAQETRSVTETYAGGGGAASNLLGTPVSNLFPGNVPVKPSVKGPAATAEAVGRGMRYFLSFNCVGCHAPNGGGGMGPSLSDSAFIYGSDPANIYLSIYQGRPRGMPSWGAMLPDNIIWDIVAYVQSISKNDTKEWGTTMSALSPKAPQIEQVPAQVMTTVNPWQHTEAFSDGQKPNQAK